MNWLIQAVITGATAFVATNIDDILILMLFFAQVNTTFRLKHIFVGQYLGFTVLIVISLPGFFGGLVLPRTWIGLLGLIPIAIGIKQLLDQKSSEPEIQLVSNEIKQPKAVQPVLSVLASFFASPTYQVATITVANGGDNVGIYVPLFANSSLLNLGVILSVFFVMVGGWCLIAYQLTRRSIIAQILTRYGSAIVPYVLVGLGLLILIDSEAYRLLEL